ncbi:hypothetical protein LINPERHAP2_LOCUS12458, partial [Linum perenne]
MHLEDIRYALDLCTDFVWMSYADRTEEFALDGDILWRSVTPLLCIDCIASLIVVSDSLDSISTSHRTRSYQ